MAQIGRAGSEKRVKPALIFPGQVIMLNRQLLQSQLVDTKHWLLDPWKLVAKKSDVLQYDTFLTQIRREGVVFCAFSYMVNVANACMERSLARARATREGRRCKLACSDPVAGPLLPALQVARIGCAPRVAYVAAVHWCTPE